MSYVMSAKDQQKFDRITESYERLKYLDEELEELKGCLGYLKTQKIKGSEVRYYKKKFFKTIEDHTELRFRIYELFNYFAKQCYAVDGLKKFDYIDLLDSTNFERLLETYPEVFPKKLDSAGTHIQVNTLFEIDTPEVVVYRIEEDKKGEQFRYKLDVSMLILANSCVTPSSCSLIFFPAPGNNYRVTTRTINKKWIVELATNPENCIIWWTYSANDKSGKYYRKFACVFEEEKKCKLFLAYMNAVLKLLRHEAWSIVIDKELGAEEEGAAVASATVDTLAGGEKAADTLLADEEDGEEWEELYEEEKVEEKVRPVKNGIGKKGKGKKRNKN